MRKLASLMFAGAMALAAAGIATSANATQFTGTFDVTPNTDPGLVIKTNPDNGGINAPAGFGLTAVNQTFTAVNLFSIYTDEDSLESDDLNGDLISVLFNFTSPSTSGTETGTVVGIDGGFFDSNRGTVSWNAPVVLNFGTGGKLQISLTNATFNKLDTTWDFFNLDHNLLDGPVYGANVSATFKLLAVDTGPVGGAVPEPATWGMMIMGFGLAGAVVRRRRAALATFA